MTIHSGRKQGAALRGKAWSLLLLASIGGSGACGKSNSSTESPVDGACGSANGATLSAAPTTGLCDVGAASTVSGTGPWVWGCAGVDGGTTAICIASAQASSAGEGLTIPGVVCDGVTDNAAAINAAFSSAANNSILMFPAGICVFESPLQVPVAIKNITIAGQGKASTELLFSGADPTADLLTVGTGYGGVQPYNITLQGFRIWSSTPMTAGTAIHLHGAEILLKDFEASRYGTANNTLWNGVWFDETGAASMSGDYLVNAQNDAVRVSGCGPSCATYDLWISGSGKIGGSKVGVHVGGGFDGVHIGGSAVVTNNGTNYLQDSALDIGSHYNQNIWIGPEVDLVIAQWWPSASLSSVAAAGSGGTPSLAHCQVHFSAWNGIRDDVDVATNSLGGIASIHSMQVNAGYAVAPSSPIAVSSDTCGDLTGAALDIGMEPMSGNNVYVDEPTCAEAFSPSLVIGAALGNASNVNLLVHAYSSGSSNNQRCTVMLTAAAISNAASDGILVDDANALVAMDSGTDVYGNRGYGINASVPWAGLLSVGVIRDNTGHPAQTAPNVVMPAGFDGIGIDNTGNPAVGGTCAAKWTSGYFDGVITVGTNGCAPDQNVALTFAQPAPNNWECVMTNWTFGGRTLTQTYGTQTLSKFAVGTAGLNAGDEIHYQCVAR